MPILHITNGDATVAIMRAAGIADDILPWRDVLHDGPVPRVSSLPALSALRARFIADCGWAELTRVQADFHARDAQLARSREYEEVTLWFEHDLYDQLQLLQLLDWFALNDIRPARLNLVQANDYLGRMNPIRLAGLYSAKRPVGSAQLKLARGVWTAFTAATPQAWFGLLSRDTAVLPYLRHAVVRLLEEYPADADGLSRTERGILVAVADGETQIARLFGHWQRYEEPLFMGDSSFWMNVQRLITAPHPAVRTAHGEALRLPASQSDVAFRQQRVVLTDIGHALLERRCDWLELNGIDKWIGGVRLNQKNGWRWSPLGQRVVRSRR